MSERLEVEANVGEVENALETSAAAMGAAACVSCVGCPFMQRCILPQAAEARAREAESQLDEPTESIAEAPVKLDYAAALLDVNGPAVVWAQADEPIAPKVVEEGDSCSDDRDEGDKETAPSSLPWMVSFDDLWSVDPAWNGTAVEVTPDETKGIAWPTECIEAQTAPSQHDLQQTVMINESDTAAHTASPVVEHDNTPSHYIQLTEAEVAQTELVMQVSKHSQLTPEGGDQTAGSEIDTPRVNMESEETLMNNRALATDEATEYITTESFSARSASEVINEHSPQPETTTPECHDNYVPHNDRPSAIGSETMVRKAAAPDMVVEVLVQEQGVCIDHDLTLQDEPPIIESVLPTEELSDEVLGQDLGVLNSSSELTAEPNMESVSDNNTLNREPLRIAASDRQSLVFFGEVCSSIEGDFSSLPPILASGRDEPVAAGIEVVSLPPSTVEISDTTNYRAEASYVVHNTTEIIADTAPVCHDGGQVETEAANAGYGMSWLAGLLGMVAIITVANYRPADAIY